LNPPPGKVTSGTENIDDALFLLDTRCKVSGGNFLTLARKIREQSSACHICFMASSTADMSLCYKHLVRPSAFFLKPVDAMELRSLISEIEGFENSRRLQKGDAQILLKTRGNKRTVKASSVLYFTSYDKKVLCCTEKGDKIDFYDSLANLEERYKNFFLRCHSGFLVNKKRITGFSKKGMSLLLTGLSGAVLEIPVSKSRCREVETFVETELAAHISG